MGSAFVSVHTRGLGSDKLARLFEPSLDLALAPLARTCETVAAQISAQLAPFQAALQHANLASLDERWFIERRVVGPQSDVEVIDREYGIDVVVEIMREILFEVRRFWKPAVLPLATAILVLMLDRTATWLGLPG